MKFLPGPKERLIIHILQGLKLKHHRIKNDPQLCMHISSHVRNTSFPVYHMHIHMHESKKKRKKR